MTCGRGKSCIGECSALEATLCPSGNCTGDPEDCNPSIILEEEEEDNHRERRAVANQASWQFNWCSPRCNVRRHSACCFHSGCRSKRKQRCSWLSYLTGELNKNLFHIQLFRQLLSKTRQHPKWVVELSHAGASRT